MASLRYLTGDPRYYNLLARAALITPSPGANPLFALANLYDGDPATPFIFDSESDNNGWLVDLNNLLNSNLDAWSGGAPVSWTKTTAGIGASVTETTAAGEVRSGSAAKCECLNSTGEAKIEEDFRVRSGERADLDGWMRGDGARSGQVSILNRHTNRYLRQDGTWGAYQTLFTETGTAYVNKRGSQFQVEPYATTLRDTCILRLTLKYNASEAGGAGTAFFDDWCINPAFNHVSVHNHNADPSLRFEIYAGDTLATLVSQGTVAAPNPQPSFHKTFANPIYKRFVRLRWEIAPPLAIRYAGEAILAYATAATMHPQFGYELKPLHPQTRNVSRGREVRSRKDAQHIERALRLPFGLRPTEYDELRQEWYERSWGGHFPMVVVPLDTEDVVIHGRLTDSLAVRRAFLNRWDPGDVLLTESPGPAVTA